VRSSNKPMRTDALITPATLHAIAATILRNLVAFAAWVAEWSAWWPFQRAIKASLRAKLRLGGRAFQRIVFLLAAAQVAPPLRIKRTHHPANAPRGFRMQTSGKARRFIHISGLHEGSLHARIARLKRMLENLALYVAGCCKRLNNCAKKSRLVLTRAIADVCEDLARACAPGAADTS
jgi:hypothetical protein